MLKQCCDIAEFTLLKHCDNLTLDEAQSSTQKSIINMRSIIEKQWSYEVSTNASKEIFQKKWNMPAFLPLTSDIQLFRNHLIHVQNVSIQELKNNPNNQKSFKNLEESVLAQLILLNRRRSGEVQRLFEGRQCITYYFHFLFFPETLIFYSSLSKNHSKNLKYSKNT